MSSLISEVRRQWKRDASAADIWIGIGFIILGTVAWFIFPKYQLPCTIGSAVLTLLFWFRFFFVHRKRRSASPRR
ncbi:MAG: hypothetical protein ABI615_09910 [Chthoniobacterales bacterium]